MGANNPDAPAIVSALQDMIQATTAWTDAGGVAAGHHYPHMAEPSADTVFPREVTSHRTIARPAFVGVAAPQYELRVTLQAFGRYAHDITGVDVDAKSISVAGDTSSQVSAGSQLVVRNSTDNDGIYDIASVSYAAGSDTTTYVLTEAPTGATADGTLYVGSVDALANAIVEELLEQATGVWISEVDNELADLPARGTKPASSFETVQFTIMAGLEAAA